VFIYPRGGNAVQLPPDPPPTSLSLSGTQLRVTEPFGIDTYVMLTSIEPIPNAELVFSGEGARTRGANAAPAGESALAQFIETFSTGRTRGMRMSTPASWSLQRMSVRSVASH
jgi:hypothetical protein